MFLDCPTEFFFFQDLLCCVKMMLSQLKYTALYDVGQGSLHSMYLYLLANDWGVFISISQ